MIERALNQITLADIEALKTYRRSESATLDFKEALPDPGPKGVRSFLADITAFANSDGGDIVIGVREDKNGSAAEIVGISNVGLDERLRGLEDQLRSCVDPIVPLFKVQEISFGDEKVVLVIRVGASMIAPHRVVYEKSSRFYRRANRSNFEMSTAEIRQAFAASTDLPQRIRDLHHKAVAATSGKDMPCPLLDGPTLVLTVAPLSVLREVRDIRIPIEHAVLPPDPMGGIDWVVGLDGLLALVQVDPSGRGARAWSINHRRGYLDFAWAIGRVVGGQHRAWPRQVVDHVPGAARSAMTILRSFGVEGPWIAMATVLKIKGYSLVMGDDYSTGAAWQDVAYLGDVVDDTMSEDALQPIVEGFWRLFGVDNPPRPRR